MSLNLIIEDYVGDIRKDTSANLTILPNSHLLPIND